MTVEFSWEQALSHGPRCHRSSLLLLSSGLELEGPPVIKTCHYQYFLPARLVWKQGSEWLSICGELWARFPPLLVERPSAYFRESVTFGMSSLHGSLDKKIVQDISRWRTFFKIATTNVLIEMCWVFPLGTIWCHFILYVLDYALICWS